MKPTDLRMEKARRMVLPGLLATALLSLTGCIAPAPYDAAPAGSAPALTGSTETLPNTFPPVTLAHNTQVTRKYVADLSGKMTAFLNTGAAQDLDSGVLFTGLRQVLHERFGDPAAGQDAYSGLAMIYDARVVMGQMSGSQTKVTLTGTFLDSGRKVVDTIHGEGVATIPYPAWTLVFQPAAKDALADFAHHLDESPALTAFAKQRQQEVEQARQVAAAERQRRIAEMFDRDDGGKQLFALDPNPELPVTQVTELLITWKNRHLDNVLKNATTAELRDYVDQIEHTIFKATDASEREKDAAQQLVAAGTEGGDAHTNLSRAYRLRIEVLKPMLAAIKEEIANRSR